MSDFERQQPEFRIVETHYGDDLPTIAFREMGDGNRWVDLIWLNDLVPPYITDDPRLAGNGVLLTGSIIKIPAPVGLWSGNEADLERIYAKDVKLTGKQIVAGHGGDLQVVSGVDNLHQQLSHIVVTPRGQAKRHPDYGCMIWRLIGKANGPTAGLLGAEYVRSALRSDYRVLSVDESKTTISGDSLRITAKVVATDGNTVEIEETGA